MNASFMHDSAYTLYRCAARYTAKRFYYLLIQLPILLFFITYMHFAMAIERTIFDELKGIAFSDPSYVVSLPDEWQQKGIKHPPEFGDVDLAIALNQQIYPFMAPLIHEYAERKGFKVKIVDTTCGSAAGYMFKKQVDIASFCCPPGKVDRLPGIRFHTLAIHPVIFIVHPSNPVNEISLENLRRVYSGELENWSQVGGENKKINVAGPLHCKKRPGHWKLLLPHENHFSANFFNLGLDDSAKQPAADPNMISFVGLLTTQNQWKDTFITQKTDTIKTLEIDGYRPEDSDALVSRRYPVYRVFNLTTWQSPETKNKLADELVDYMINALKFKKEYVLVPAAKLRKSGWKFKEDELIGEPGQEVR